MPESLQLCNIDRTYQLFPNGHAEFLTKSAIKTVNRVRDIAIQSEYNVLKPYVCAPHLRSQKASLHENETDDDDTRMRRQTDKKHDKYFGMDIQDDINDNDNIKHKFYDGFDASESEDEYMVR